MKITNKEVHGLEQFAVMDPEVLSRIDMAEIYQMAGLIGIAKNTFCPTILLSHQLIPLISHSDMAGHQILTLDLNLSNEERMKAVVDWLSDGNGDYFKGACYEEKGNDMCILYFFLSSVAKSLGARCPLILDRDEVIEDEPFAIFKCTRNEEYIGAYMVLRSDWAENMVSTLYFLATEMRHVWQREKHNERFYANLKLPEDCEDENEYFLQDVLVDAAAYGYRLMLDIFGIKIEKALSYNQAFLKAVIEKANKMFPSYSSELHTMGEMMNGLE